MKTTQGERSVSDGVDVKVYGSAGRQPPKHSSTGRTLWTLQYLTDSSAKFRLVADRNSSSERWFVAAWGGTASLPLPLRCYKPWPKPKGTLTSTDKNLGATSQRGQHLISFKYTTSTCS